MLQRKLRQLVLVASATLIAATATLSVSSAQQPPVRVRGEIVKVDGNTLLIKVDVTVRTSQSSYPTMRV